MGDIAGDGRLGTGIDVIMDPDTLRRITATVTAHAGPRPLAGFVVRDAPPSSSASFRPVRTSRVPRGLTTSISGSTTVCAPPTIHPNADMLELATGFGDTASVGVGGITLGGGVGFLIRRHGLTIDSLLAAEVVTADGEIRHADPETHPDLFWAIRGGGGNFGIATRLRFRLHAVDTIVGGTLVLPATPEVIAGFVAEADDTPIVRLNRAVAVGEADGALAGLAALAPVDEHIPRRDAVAAYLHEKKRRSRTRGPPLCRRRPQRAQPH